MLALGSTGYLLLVLRKWRGDVAALDTVPARTSTGTSAADPARADESAPAQPTVVTSAGHSGTERATT